MNIKLLSELSLNSIVYAMEILILLNDFWNKLKVIDREITVIESS
jgi:hypothetical protein